MIWPLVPITEHIILTAITNILTEFLTGTYSELRVVIVTVGGVHRAEEVDYSIGALRQNQTFEVFELKLGLCLGFVVTEVGEADIDPPHLFQRGTDRDVCHGGAGIFPLSRRTT